MDEAETLREKASRLMNEYEAVYTESAFAQGLAAYQQLPAEQPDAAGLHLEYGYLQECHGRVAIRRAARCYEQAIELDPATISRDTSSPACRRR